jgi:hypothetical protein
MDLKKEWQIFLINAGITGADVARALGESPQNINRKINTGTIKAAELAEILEKYGYTLAIVKKEQ